MTATGPLNLLDSKAMLSVCGITGSRSTLSNRSCENVHILRKRPYIKKEWCISVVENPVRSEQQEGNRRRFWAPIDELGGRYLRVITLEDGVTIHNAFPDRGFRP